uniref:Fe2OG dioxygenase domain-containing protein n=4 Tax=Triticinae TaxID=1648030 RepID=A0A453GKV6_AEGTS
MERIGDKVISRAEITDAASATFADSTVIPDRYARSDEVRDGVVVGSDESYELPVVDMARLLHPEFSEAEIAKLGSACRDWGFFQLTNHGVDETVVQDMKDNTLQFFGLPLEKKKAVAIQANGFEGFGHHYNRASSEKLDWAESLILVTQQHEQRNNEFWPADPSTFRVALDKYSVEMSNLTSRLTVFMASDLGVEQEALMATFQGKTQSVAFHYYPPCRHPDKVIGITPHHDGLGLTLLLHVDDTPGLQVRKNGRWYPLNPLPGALVINVGDILQILTNGTYKSAEHRVLPDVEKGRATVVMFQNACVAGIVKPLPELGEATYKAIDHVEYVKGNFRALAEGTRFVDSLKIMDNN